MKEPFTRMFTRIVPKNGFSRQVGVLAGGAAGTQLILVLASPLLTRLYSPQDFGLFSIYTSILAIVSVVATLRYEWAIPAAENEAEAVHVAVLCLMLVCMFSLLLGLALLAFGDVLLVLFSAARLKHFAWLLPVGVLFAGVYQTLSAFNLRHKRFKRIAKTKLTQALALFLAQMIGYKLGAIALISAHAGSQSVGSISLGRSLVASPRFRDINAQGLWSVAKKHKAFPIYSTWGALLNVAGAQLPSLLLAALFSPAAAGMYALAYRVLGAPITIISAAVGNVFISGAVDARSAGKLAEISGKLCDRLLNLAVAPAMVMLVTAPSLFAIFFGQAWYEAGTYACWMIPWLCTVFVVSPLASVQEIVGGQRRAANFQFVLLTVRLGAIFVGALAADVEVAVALFSIGSAVCWFAYLFIVGHVLGVDRFKLLKSIGISVAWGAACLCPILIANLLGLQGVWMFSSTLIAMLAVLVRVGLSVKEYW